MSRIALDGITLAVKEWPDRRDADTDYGLEAHGDDLAPLLDHYASIAPPW